LNLTEVTGKLQISSNNALTDINLPQLTHVGGSFSVSADFTRSPHLHVRLGACACSTREGKDMKRVE